MSEWKEYKLGELIETNARSIGKNYPNSKILYLDTGSITCNSIDTYQEFEIDKAPSRAKRLVNQDDIIYSSVRPNQLHYGYITNPPDNLVVSTGFVTITCNPKQLNAKFLYYYLTQSHITEFLHSVAEASTSAYPSLKPSDIEALDIEIPSLNEQRRIAAILSSLDDKIELLHRENATLEQMAETLFRQWFVVEAKEEWEEGTIVDFAKHCKDSINPQKHPDTVFLHYSIPAYDDGKKPTTETGGNIQSNKYLVLSNCVLFSKLNPHKDKRVWLMLDDVPDNAICSTEFQIVKPTNPEYLYFLYGWLTNKENYDEIASGVGGTSGSHQRIDPKSIFSFACPKVDLETICKYNKQVEPLFNKQRNNQKQIQTLIQTRDGLLPRLMGGEVKVDEL